MVRERWGVEFGILHLPGEPALLRMIGGIHSLLQHN
jgi:hypothetical protein